MNRLKGVIRLLDYNDYVSYVEVGTEVGPLSLVLVETPSKVDYLKTGKEITVIFNPTTVKISKSKPQDMLVDNIIQCKVIQIREGKILSAVTLKHGDKQIISYITTKSLRKTDLKPEDDVFAIISPTDIMVEV